MIPYHGTPIGGRRVDAANFLQGRHALVSFYRPDDLPVVLEVCQSFVLDNGAYSHWRAGKGAVDYDAYVEWVDSFCRHPAFDWCLIPDLIDGTELQNKDWVLNWPEANKQAKGVPVWHLHESFDYLNWLIERFDTVALGSSGEWSHPNSKKWWERMHEVMAVACDERGRPRCNLHGLRMLNPKVFTRLPLSSADSTNAGVNCGSKRRFGMYVPPTAAQRAEIIASRIEVHQSAAVWVPDSKLKEEAANA
jgi:hypothetical protein